MLFSAECSSKKIDDCYSSTDVNLIGGTYYHKGYLFTGWIERSGGDEPKAVFSVVEGLLEGRYTEYYKNNQIRLIQDYSKGVKEGLYTIYWENGMVSDSFYYVNGRPDGEILGYHRGGSERSWD